MEKAKISFLNSKYFLIFVSFCLISVSIFLWKNQQEVDKTQTQIYTKSTADYYSQEAENRFTNIYNALNILSNRGVPGLTKSDDDWGKAAQFYLDSFSGLKNIAWVDNDFIVRRIVAPDDKLIKPNQKANELIMDKYNFILWTPVYNGTELKGFIIGEINIEGFISKIITEIKEDFYLQVSNKGKVVYNSELWKELNSEYLINENVNLRNTTVLNFAFAPSEVYIQTKALNTLQILIFSLLSSIAGIVALFYAQKFKSISNLNEKRYRNLLEDVQLVAIILDNHGIVTFCNDFLLEITGWKRDEVLGKNWFKKFLPENTDNSKIIERKFIDSLQSGFIVSNYENVIVTKSQSKRWIEFSNTILRDTRGNIIGVASLGQDITEKVKNLAKLKKTIIELKELDKLKDNFLNNTSHELRTPLIPIKSQAQMFLAGDYGNLTDEQSKAMEMILRNEEHLNFLTRDLLDIAKIKSKKFKLILEKVDLTILLKDEVENMTQRAKDNMLTLKLNIEAQVPQIKVDKIRLNQVLNNLMDNALKFTPKGGLIEIGMKIDNPNYVTIYIKDSGIGIKKENFEKIFNPFFQVDGDLNRKYRGTGLGLGISKGIIELHGGKIFVESNGIGHGSKFIFTLPLKN